VLPAARGKKEWEGCTVGLLFPVVLSDPSEHPRFLVKLEMGNVERQNPTGPRPALSSRLSRPLE